MLAKHDKGGFVRGFLFHLESNESSEGYAVIEHPFEHCV